MIYFGREFCPAKGHDSRACPICSFAVHGDASPSREAAPASPQKGIVFYSDRVAQLQGSPELTLSSSKKKRDAEVEAEAVVPDGAKKTKRVKR